MEKIKKTEQFTNVYNKGFKIYTRYTIIFSTHNEIQNFGFVASKKVGNAVKRNRLKRLFREVVRKNSQFFNTKKSYVIVARKSCSVDFEKINYELMKNDILQGLKKNEKNRSRNNKNIPKNF